MIVARASLGSVINTLCVNFLLYVVLIIVFYMLVRFYFEEETTSNISERGAGYGGTKRATVNYGIEESNDYGVEDAVDDEGHTGKLLNEKTAVGRDVEKDVNGDIQSAAVKSSLEIEYKKERVSSLGRQDTSLTS